MPPLGLLYVDGRTQPTLRQALEGHGIKVRFARKTKGHSYKPGLNGFGKRLLILADATARVLRESREGNNGLERIITT